MSNVHIIPTKKAKAAIREIEAETQMRSVVTPTSCLLVDEKSEAHGEFCGAHDYFTPGAA